MRATKPGGAAVSSCDAEAEAPKEGSGGAMAARDGSQEEGSLAPPLAGPEADISQPPSSLGCVDETGRPEAMRRGGELRGAVSRSEGGDQVDAGRDSGVKDASQLEAGASETASGLAGSLTREGNSRETKA